MEKPLIEYWDVHVLSQACDGTFGEEEIVITVKTVSPMEAFAYGRAFCECYDRIYRDYSHYVAAIKPA